MKVLENQTIYQCSYCGKRFLCASSVPRHERAYCRSTDSPRIQNCPHRMQTVWTPIAGEEHRMEPDYEVCEYCGLTDDEIDQLECERQNNESDS